MRLKPKQLFASLALILVILSSLTLIIVHVLDVEANYGPISLYSLGPFGWIMRVGFISLGLAFLSLLSALWNPTRPGILYYLDKVLLLISGIGLVLVGIFNTDRLGDSPTLTGSIHSWSALTWSTSASLAILIFAPAFRQDGISLTIRRISRNLGIMAIAVWSIGFLSYGTILAPVQPRLFFLVVFVWVSLIAVQFRSSKLAREGVKDMETRLETVHER